MLIAYMYLFLVKNNEKIKWRLNSQIITIIKNINTYGMFSIIKLSIFKNYENKNLFREIW